MEIDALKSLLAFVETGSITRAAKQVNRTQSAVSMQMKKLEQDLGKRLFEKNGRNLLLSKEGHQLVGHAKQLITHYDSTLNAIKSHNSKLRIRLGCPDDYADTILPKVVKKMHALWPDLDLQIRCLPSNLIREQIDSGELDLGIVTRSFDSEEGIVIARDRGVWVCNGDIHLAQQTPLPLVTFQQDCRFHHAAIEGLHKQAKHFKLIAMSGSVAAMHGLVKAGLAIGAMASLSKGDLVELYDSQLPDLPEIFIVLINNMHTSSFISQSQLQQLGESFER